MTREEAIDFGKMWLEINADSKDSNTYEFFIMAIEALEQEPVLDKIRAEIEQLTITEGGDDYVRKMAELFSLKMKVLQIIDKYKSESEDK